MSDIRLPLQLVRMPLPQAVVRLMKKEPATLAEGFRKAYQRATKFALRAMEAYIEAGEHLAALRERVEHGNWAMTLEGLGLSKSAADRLLLLGTNSEVARAALEQKPDLTLVSMEGVVRQARALPLEEMPNDMPAIAKAAIDKSQQHASARKVARRGSDMARQVRIAFDALEAHAHDDPTSPEVARIMALVERRLAMIQGMLTAEDATAHPQSPAGPAAH